VTLFRREFRESFAYAFFIVRISFFLKLQKKKKEVDHLKYFSGGISWETGRLTRRALRTALAL
jgi:hypothetical protein